MRSSFLRIAVIFIAPFWGAVVYAQSTEWIVDTNNSVIKFITNGPFGEVDGNLYGLQAAIRFDENNPDSASFYATIRASSVKTGLGMRDEHLCDGDFFNRGQFPVFTFQSKKVIKNLSDGFIITGNLTIKKTSKQINLPFTFQRTASGAIFKGEITMDCLDYGVGSSSKGVKVVLQVPVTPKKRQD